MNNQEVKSKSKKLIDELNKRKPNEKLVNADRDLESLMAMRDRRASRYGIDISESFFDFGQWSETNSYRDRRFVVSHEKMFMKHKIDFKKNNMFIYQHESSLIAAESDVIDLIDSSRLPSEAYICPNCGSMSSSDELSSTGCPFCGAHFSIPQLYPKVSHFSYSEHITDLSKDVPRKIWKPIFIVWAIAYIPLYLMGFSIWEEFSLLAAMLYDVGMIAIAAIPAFFVYAILTYFVSVKTMFDDSNQRKQKREADHKTSVSNQFYEKLMAKYGPVFNFQYFSSRVYNLLGAMIYAENMKECPFYSGPDFIGYFDTIINYIPIGLEISSFKIDESGKCTVDCKVIADTYAYVNGKILYRKAEFYLKTSKNLNYPMDINFSAHTYKCDGCGANFDVTKSMICPFCGRPHDLLDEEWYIDGQVKGAFKK